MPCRGVGCLGLTLPVRYPHQSRGEAQQRHQHPVPATQGDDEAAGQKGARGCSRAEGVGRCGSGRVGSRACPQSPEGLSEQQLAAAVPGSTASHAEWWENPIELPARHVYSPASSKVTLRKARTSSSLSVLLTPAVYKENRAAIGPHPSPLPPQPIQATN